MSIQARTTAQEPRARYKVPLKCSGALEMRSSWPPGWAMFTMEKGRGGELNFLS